MITNEPCGKLKHMVSSFYGDDRKYLIFVVTSAACVEISPLGLLIDFYF